LAHLLTVHFDLFFTLYHKPSNTKNERSGAPANERTLDPISDSKSLIIIIAIILVQ